MKRNNFYFKIERDCFLDNEKFALLFLFYIFLHYDVHIVLYPHLRRRWNSIVLVSTNLPFFQAKTSQIHGYTTTVHFHLARLSFGVISDFAHSMHKLAWSSQSHNFYGIFATKIFSLCDQQREFVLKILSKVDVKWEIKHVISATLTCINVLDLMPLQDEFKILLKV